MGRTGTRNVHSAALEKSHVILDDSGGIYSVKAFNNTVVLLYLHIFDAASLPANGTAPDRCPIPVGAGSVNGDEWPGCTNFGKGCVAALSSTLATLTLVATADGWFDAEVI